VKLNFIGAIRRAEIVVLRAALSTGRFFKRIGRWVLVKIGPNWRKYLKFTVLALVVLYLIGGVAFGVRLYKQKRFETIDRFASYIYPFPVATVGRSVVLEHELQQKVYWAYNFAEKTQSQIPENLPKQILDEIIKDRISMMEADRLDIKVTGEDISAIFGSVFEGVGGEEQTEMYVREFYNMSLNQLKQEAVPKMALQKIREKEFVKVKARHILVKEEKRANEALKKIKDGGKFEDVAKDYSEDQASKDNGGLLADGEFIYRDSGLASEIEVPLFGLAAEQMSELVKSPLGFHILKVEEKAGTIDLYLDDWFKELQKKDYPARILI